MDTVSPTLTSAFLNALRHSWIDGRAYPAGGTGLAHVDPRNGRSTGETDDAREDCIDAAVVSACRGFDRWRALTIPEQQRLLNAFANRVEAEVDTIAALEALEVGRPISDTIPLVKSQAEFVRLQARLADALACDVVGADDQRLSLVWRRPRGVVLAITPWNVPVANVLTRVGPALAAGNSIIVKPSETCPRSAVLLARIASEAGLPDGVFNVVLGDGQHTGAVLAAHDDVKLVSFTGSSATGREIVQSAARRSMKPVLLECGGKSPSIVLDDVCGSRQLWRAIFESAFWNSGQICTARTRLIVPRARIDEAIEGLALAASDWPCGDPFNPATRLGPLASPRQLATVERYLDEARSVGSLVELPCPDTGVTTAGCFVQPQIATCIPSSSAVWKEEVFGPVTILQPFDDLAEAVTLANDTEYGLAAAVWTNRSSDAYRLARSIEAGLIEVCSSASATPGWSTLQYFEPFKQSGLGIDGGLEGLKAYTRPQSVSFSH